MADPDWDDIAANCRTKMSLVDAQNPAIRELIHEFNLMPVTSLTSRGMREPSDIREVLETAQRDGDDKARALFHELMAKRRSEFALRRTGRTAVVTGADFD